VQEERPRGLKNALGMPHAAMQDVLSQAGVTPADIDLVALSGLHSGEYVNLDPSVQQAE
jgi:3-oxoacyl-[acyl-carrier-protein] synthase III